MLFLALFRVFKSTEQLSFESPCGNGCSQKVPYVRKCFSVWPSRDSNPRPHARQPRALATQPLCLRNKEMIQNKSEVRIFKNRSDDTKEEYKKANHSLKPAIKREKRGKVNEGSGKGMQENWKQYVSVGRKSSAKKGREKMRHLIKDRNGELVRGNGDGEE